MRVVQFKCELPLVSYHRAKYTYSSVQYSQSTLQSVKLIQYVYPPPKALNWPDRIATAILNQVLWFCPALFREEEKKALEITLVDIK